MARVLWMSDAPSHPTGFGLVTSEVCARLAGRGHGVRVLGWWGVPTGGPAGVEVVACPVSPDAASAAVAAALASFRPDVLVTLGDLPWVGYLARASMRRMLDAAGVAWCAHYPIDGCRADGTMPEAWAAILGQADLAIAMSEFGRAVSARSGIAAAFIPHGCDTALFRPASNQEAAKRALGLQGRFVVLSDVRNHRRKMLPRLLDIFGEFAACRDDCVLLLNSNERIDDDIDSYSYDLRADIAALGLDRRVRLAKPGDALTMAQVAALYAAADVHLSASYGEGFGLPTLQAAASGVVPVGGDHSANSELLGQHGIAVPPAGLVDDEFGLRRHFMDRALAVAALDRLYRDRAELARRSRLGREFARRFDWEVLMDAWENALAGAAPLASRPPPPAMAVGAALRPTGHDAATLPLPLLGIPVRRDGAGFGTASMSVLADAACAAALRPLTSIFPEAQIDICASAAQLDIGRRPPLLVVDPAGQLGTALREECRRLGVSHIGPADGLAPTDAPGLLALARRLLTDQSEADRRLNA